MRMHACIVVAMLATSLGLFSQSPLPTSPQPVAIIADRLWAHVLTRAVDVNFNGTQDAGDTVAVWHRFNQDGLDNGSFAFPWTNVYASRPAIDTVNELMYVIVGDSLYALNTAFMVPLVREGWSEGGVALSLMNDTTLLVSTRKGYTDPGVVRFVHAFTGAPMSMQIDAGVNVQMTKPLNDSTVLVLSEGNFGAADGTLALAQRNGTTWTSTVLCTGGTPNHFVVDGNTAYVVMNGSHEVVIVNLETRSITSRISTGTSGYDGPREAAIHGGRLFVTTFTGNVLVIDVASASIVGRITVDAKPEALAVINGKLWVTRTYVAGGYAAERNVNIYELNDATSVTNVMQREGATQAIIASGNVVRLPECFTTGTVAIMGMDGRAHTASVDAGATPSINIAHLVSGVYLLRSGACAVVVMKP